MAIYFRQEVVYDLYQVENSTGYFLFIITFIIIKKKN